MAGFTIGPGGVSQEDSRGAPGSAGLTSALRRRRIAATTKRVRAQNRFATQPAGTPYKPWTAPSRPPEGTYDPALDAQLRSAQRGFGDLQRDAERDTTRQANDLSTNRTDVNRQRTQTLADTQLGLDRGQQNYTRDIQGLDRTYSNLARKQAEGARQAGVSEGGGMLAAMAKRSENRAWEQAPVDTNWQRQQQDAATTVTRTNEGADRALGQLDLSASRATEDRGQNVTRAGRELGFYNQDIGAQRFYDARQTEYLPPNRPAYEKVTPGGATYRVATDAGGNRDLQLSSGKVIQNSGNPTVDAELSRFNAADRTKYQQYLAAGWKKSPRSFKPKDPVAWVRGGRR